mgnify:CR=1 FL=1
MKLTFAQSPDKKKLLIYPLFENETAKDAKLKKIITQLKAAKRFEGKEGQTFFLFG